MIDWQQTDGRMDVLSHKAP